MVDVSWINYVLGHKRKLLQFGVGSVQLHILKLKFQQLVPICSFYVSICTAVTVVSVHAFPGFQIAAAALRQAGQSIASERQFVLAAGSLDFQINNTRYSLTTTAVAINFLNLEFACSESDCCAIQGTGGCARPDEGLLSRASVAMNAYYQARGRNSWNCFFNGTGLITITDPSLGTYKYA
ncbi:glucan endo-1,3-beta-glucosidase 1-like isoform X1 [Miscanthus floridulus]|uniref:glucan endo-1,3-beta-glucosidase 1-like isoform X1 n=1 Tax=Miscanthus floridulus TaxID=154761 RepID=UPI00345AC05F